MAFQQPEIKQRGETTAFFSLFFSFLFFSLFVNASTENERETKEIRFFSTLFCHLNGARRLVPPFYSYNLGQSCLDNYRLPFLSFDLSRCFFRIVSSDRTTRRKRTNPLTRTFFFFSRGYEVPQLKIFFCPDPLIFAFSLSFSHLLSFFLFRS